MGKNGGRPATTGEHLIEVVGLGLGAATEGFVRTSVAEGYTVVASGPNRFRLAKTYRPKWALTAAIATSILLGLGLLFLLVKRTSTGDAVINEDRSGVKLRLTGSLDPALIDRLRSALVIDPAAGRVSRPVMSSAAPVVDPASFVVPPRPAAPVSVVQPAMAVPEPVLVLADGRSIVVGAGGVIGRDPVASAVGVAAHQLADPSLSKTHLAFGPLPDGVWVEDHHSTNGTTVLVHGISNPCNPGQRVAAPFGAQVIAGDVRLMVGKR